MNPERVLAAAALLLAGVALLMAGVRDAPAPAPPGNTAALEGRMRELEADREKDRRRLERLEAEIVDAHERLGDVRAALVGRDAGAAVRPAPPAEAHPAAELAATPALDDAVERVLENRDRVRREERAARREERRERWLGDLKERLGLDDAQLARVREALAEEERRRAELFQHWEPGDPPPDGGFGRRRSDEAVRAVLTPEQQTAFDALPLRDRRPPRMAGPPGP
ncbi:MAG: hypothetical protein HY904_01525 [Deltaproteobacteria bacterium]|nr:hypothetical protein [Deltaproteobacteria bacterium]